MTELSLLQKILVWAPPVLFAITVHEAAHGYAARALGDDTAARLGRLSLNPLRHIDPIGTVLVPGVLLMLGGFLFGWAKPVPVDMRRLHRPRQDMALVAAAGPAANAVMALGWGLLLKWQAGGSGETALLLSYMAVAGIIINLVLMVLNLLPMPPLDGSRVLAGLLPEPAARVLDRIEPFGLYLILGLMISGVLTTLLQDPLRASAGLLYALLGLDARLMPF